jgi:hypothetical protein
MFRSAWRPDAREPDRRRPSIILSGRCRVAIGIRIIRVVLFLNVIRREAARATIAGIAEALVVNRAKSRRQHLRNGIAALLSASSQIAWRPTPLVSLVYLTRRRVQAELTYGLGEVGAALSPPPVLRQRRALLVAGPASAAVVATAVLLARRRASEAAASEAAATETVADAGDVRVPVTT